MSARRCHCGKPIQVDDNGDLRCFNGHSQPEAVGDLVRAMAELVAGPLRELRAAIEEQGIGVESLREEAGRSTASPPPPSTPIWRLRRRGLAAVGIGCATMPASWEVASRAASGADGSSGRPLRTRGSRRSTVAQPANP
jgi:hypothetical protein